MRTLRTFWFVRAVMFFSALSLAWLQVGPAWAGTARQARIDRDTARRRLESARRASGLAPGLTQTPDAAQRAKIAARERAEAMKTAADVRALTAAEMSRATGRGPLRNPYFNGTLPWQKSLRDVNLCDGNLFKSFTDIQVAPARGAGLVLQRTYNSNDAREGAFGMGWGHAYDIRIQEAADVRAEAHNSTAVSVQPVSGAAQAGGDDTVNEVPRTDFFGAKHTYHRDADGLYSPPPYLYDEMSSDYNNALVNGPVKVDDDTEKGMDGTVKHYASVVSGLPPGSGGERACDSITDRYGNATLLAYVQSYAQPDGSTRKLLTSVTDPAGRSLTFQWANMGTAADPHYRITEADAPTDPATGTYAYRVTYAYYALGDPASGGAPYELKSVTLDPDGLSRTTTYTYTSCGGTYYDTNGNPQSATEVGLLASITDPQAAVDPQQGHAVYYAYSAVAYTCNGTQGDQGPSGYVVPEPTGSVWVTGVAEPAGVDTNGNARMQTWSVIPVGAYGGLNTVVTSSSGAYLMATVDARLRFRGYFVTTLQGEADQTAYDDSNNVQNVFTSYSNYGPAKDYCHDDFYTYGQHGNVTGHRVGTSGTISQDFFPGVDRTTYYDAAQYFQKQSQTDMDGHLGVMGVGTDTAGAPGDPDPNPGDKGQVLWARDPGYGDPASPSYGRQFTYAYNRYGQKTSQTDLRGVTTTYAYGTSGTDLGNLVRVVQDPGGAGHLGRATAMHYDVMGRVLWSTAPSGLTSTFTYNDLGQPVSVVTPARGTVAGEAITYAYDANGRTRSVTDSLRTTTMTYEAGSDRVSSVADSVTGTVSYTYRASGERLTMALPGGGTWSYGYADTDPLWQSIQMPYPGANNHFSGGFYGSFFGGPSVGVRGLWYMPKGDPDGLTLLPESVTDDQGRTVSYTLNFAGQPLAVDSDQSFSGGARVGSLETTRLYDSYGSAPNTPGGAYPGGGLFASRGWLARTQTTWYGLNAGRQPVPRVVSEDDYAYDSDGAAAGNDGLRLASTVSTHLLNPDGSPQYAGGTPQFDQYGHLTNPILAQRTEHYRYDALNRLRAVDYGDGETQSYAFDPMGNRLGKSDTVSGTGGGTTSTGYAFDAANRLTGTTGAGAATYTSDADGNTLTDGTRTNTWDSQNRLVSCTANGTTSTYTYGADGLRRSSTVGGVMTYYIYDGTMPVREMRKDAQAVLTPTATYLQGPLGPAYRRDDTQGEGTYTDAGNVTRIANKTRWYVYDGLGSVVGEVDPSGNLTSSGTYDVYGAKRAGGTGTASTRQGFVGSLGHVSDSETGLVYMRARYYDPGTGRFISEDPSKNGENWFDYCDNNPTNSVDADGKTGENITEDLIGFTLFFMGMGVVITQLPSALPALQAAISFLNKVATYAMATISVLGPSIGFWGAALIGVKSILLNDESLNEMASLLPGGASAARAITGYSMMVLGTYLMIDSEMSSGQP